MVSWRQDHGIMVELLDFFALIWVPSGLGFMWVGAVFDEFLFESKVGGCSLTQHQGITNFSMMIGEEKLQSVVVVEGNLRLKKGGGGWFHER